MLGDLSQLRFVGLQPTPMRQVHVAQVGFVDMMQTPDISSSVGSYTLKNAHECTCMQHPFDFAKSKVITTPFDIETYDRLMRLKCKMLAVAENGNKIGYIRALPGSTPTVMHSYRTSLNGWVHKANSIDDTIRCVVAGPRHILMRDIQEFPYCLHGCTMVHYSYPNHNKMCTRACMVACMQPSVARMYAQMYVLDNLSLDKCPDVLRSQAREHMQSFVEQHILLLVPAWVPHDSMTAAMLIRECAWAVQRLIMLGMKDSNCMWSWVPKDVCKLIHRMVFA